MSKEFRFTSGVHASAGSSPWDTARTGVSLIAQPTTRQGIYDAIEAALLAAGYTQTDHTPGTRSVYFSAGESGNENFAIEMELRNGGRDLALDVSGKLDGSNELDGRCDPSDTADFMNRWDLTASDFTADMMVLCDLDFMHVFAQNQNHTSTMYSGFTGLLRRTDKVNQNLMTLAGAAVAGEFVVLDVTGFNPIVEGYKIGDRIGVLEINAAQSRAYEYALVIGISATSLTVRNLVNSYAIGAVVAMSPCPVARFMGSNDEILVEIATGSQWTSPYMPPNLGEDLHAQDKGIAVLSNRGYRLERQFPTTHDDHVISGTPYGTGGTPNQKTNRFTCRTLEVGSRFEDPLGVVPNLLAYPGSASFYTHDDQIADRLAAPNQFVPHRYTATSTRPYLWGPVPP